MKTLPSFSNCEGISCFFCCHYLSPLSAFLDFISCTSWFHGYSAVRRLTRAREWFTVLTIDHRAESDWPLFAHHSLVKPIQPQPRLIHHCDPVTRRLCPPLTTLPLHFLFLILLLNSTLPGGPPQSAALHLFRVYSVPTAPPFIS